MPLRDRNLRIALLTAVKKAVDAEIDAERADHRDMLVEKYTDEGTKTFDVKLPNGPKVATVSLSVPQASMDFTDWDAFAKWAEVNAPSLIVEVPIPAQPRTIIPARKATVEHHLHQGRAREYLVHFKPAGQNGDVVHTDTGEVVPGVTHTPEGTPKSFSVNFTPDGKDDLARAWRSGELEHVTVGSVLPAIQPPEEKP